MRLLVSFSGGETSAFLCKWIKGNRSSDEVIYVFANTGDESEMTLLFAKQCDEYFGLNLVWVESVTNPEHGEGVTAKVVSYESAARKGEPFEHMVAKYGIPNQSFNHCSRQLKQYAIQAYARSIGWNDYTTVIGIRADEIDRISKDYKEKKICYPLINEVPMTKEDINRFWYAMPFRLQLTGYQGNCRVCWKKSLRKLLTIAKEDPSAFNTFQKLEKQYEFFVPPTQVKGRKLPIRFYRGNLTVDDIIQLSREPFEIAENENIRGLPLDISDGCTESCEVF